MHNKIQIVFLFYLIFFLSHISYAMTYHVYPHDSIQQAIETAQSGDTIRIYKGTYYENLLIDKPLSIIGIGRPIINGSERDDVIRISSSNVHLNGLIITGSGINQTKQNAGVYAEPGSDNLQVINCDLTYNLFSLWIEGLNSPLISGNLITGKRDLISGQRGNGIQLYRTEKARIINNRISYVRDGIYVDVSHHAVFIGNRIHNVRYGTHYMNSYYNLWENNEVYYNRGGLALMEVRNQLVRNNKVWGNTDHGIMLRTIQDSIIEDNDIYQNQRGLFIYDAEYNTITQNKIRDNYIGVHISAGSINNNVHYNNFINNEQQIRYVATKNMDWMSNFWSNYTGWDRNGDGIGDIPYVANNIVDRLIWKVPTSKILFNSPAIQTLRLFSEQFPVLKVPSIIDSKPLTNPISI